MNVASAPDMEAVRAMSEEERRQSFPLKPIWQRSLIVAAGPIANFLLAIVIFAGLAVFAGRNVNDPYIGGVVAGSPARRRASRPATASFASTTATSRPSRTSSGW